MTIKDQLNKVKENWLILAVVVVLFLFMSGGNLFSIKSLGGGMDSVMKESAMYAPSVDLAYSRGGIYPVNGDFAPETEERKITKTASMTNEVERGDFWDAESKLEAIIKSSDSYLLNQNVNKYGTNRKSYYQGSYQIKVDTEKYDSIIGQLKNIGEVKSFNENTVDITGAYTKTETEIEVEKARLKRYEEMYDEAKDVSDKIELNDRIFNQERTIKYMEDSLKNMDQRIDYSTVYVTITEKQSEYYNIALVKISEIVKSIVISFNSLIKTLFIILPWAIALWVIRVIFKAVKKKK